ncbi:MAG TPA: hypothetical protein VFW38_01640 [Solirubrobacteraceae bacterium]|nr:hypothetical protein [Solirubrobacteraceae bacterium]
MIARVAAAILALCAIVSVASCGSGESSISRREYALERAQFEQVADELGEVQLAVHREVAASRAVWPLIYNGLPSHMSLRLQGGVKAASAVAGALPAPRFMSKQSNLTGPASGIAGVYEDYDRLAERGWRLTETGVSGIVAGPVSVERFVRANSPLYIDAIYDGHFDLSLIGKKLLDGYEKIEKLSKQKKFAGIGGFGSQLTQREIAALAAAYSIPAVRLEPHPGPGTEER